MQSPGFAVLLAVALAGAGWMASAEAASGADARDGRGSRDAIDAQIDELERGRDYKVRLSAAVRLAKTSDPRATAAMVRVLEDEPSKTMRRLAALSLSSMVDAGTSPRLRAEVERILAHAAETDRDPKVRRHARRSLDKLAEVPARVQAVSLPAAVRTPPRAHGRHSVFVHVTAPSDVTRKSPRGLSPLLHDTVRGALRKHVPEYRLDWPSQRAPTASDLEQARTRAYRVQAAVMEYRIHPRGRQAEVECAVTVQVNPWEGSDTAERWSERQAASASGRGRVRGDNHREAIAAAQRDCVTTVAERITTEQVVPFLRRLEAARK